VLKYNSNEASEYFSNNRIDFSSFYDSEKYVLKLLINHIRKSKTAYKILDIGCGAGGLGNALKNILDDKLYYTGIDINEKSIRTGEEKFTNLNLMHGDFHDLIELESLERYNLITSLSCIDWNTDFDSSCNLILNYCIKNECDFLFTFRASDKGLNNIDKSFQYVNYESQKMGEIANYIVLSYKELRSFINQFGGKAIYCQTFMGKPSVTAVTPFSCLTFGCMWISLKENNSHEFDLNSPMKINGVNAYGNIDIRLLDSH
tara:strand:- start:7302 stop:8081 length:780 start_codon:yes stop_codon:yes gene_type:complete